MRGDVASYSDDPLAPKIRVVSLVSSNCNFGVEARFIDGGRVNGAGQGSGNCSKDSYRDRCAERCFRPPPPPASSADTLAEHIHADTASIYDSFWSLKLR